MSDFFKHVLSVLQVVFPDAHRGGECSSKDGNIEGLPVRVDTSSFENYPSLFTLLAESQARGAAVHDDRPVFHISRKPGQDPIVVSSLRDFCAFAERGLYTTQEGDPDVN